MIRLIISAFIVVLLLFLYAYVVYIAICPDCVCENAAPVSLTEGQKSIVSLVGGLVSALVVGLLAATPPGESPDRIVLASVQTVKLTSDETQPSELAKTITKVITYAYLFTWLIIGMGAVYYGLLKECKASAPELAEVANSWLGIAIASAYAFFGIRPQ